MKKQYRGLCQEATSKSRQDHLGLECVLPMAELIGGMRSEIESFSARERTDSKRRMKCRMDGAAKARTLPELVRSKFSVPRFSAGLPTKSTTKKSGVVDLDHPFYAKAFHPKRTAFHIARPRVNPRCCK